MQTITATLLENSSYKHFICEVCISFRCQPAYLLLCCEESRACSAEKANLAELREDDAHIQIQQAEGADDYEGGIEEEPYDSIAGGLRLIILVVWRCHCCIHCTCKL